jgi:hypothetical protein
MTIHRGARDPPDPAHQAQAVGLPARRRGRGPHGLDLRRTKGRPSSRTAILASSNSVFSNISPSLAFSRSLSSCSPSLCPVVKLASPAARKASRHSLSVAAVTPRPHDTVSRSSPAEAEGPQRSCAGATSSRRGPAPLRRPAPSNPVLRLLCTSSYRDRPLVRCLRQPWVGGIPIDGNLTRVLQPPTS